MVARFRAGPQALLYSLSGPAMLDEIRNPWPGKRQLFQRLPRSVSES
ncbi:MAG: hypothetical protein JNJ88_15980 [Planctomycetes bacterium]|nr:hypothetical protein [Planctomycetota bacterium]